MGRDRKTITDYLTKTEEPIDELWHQALMDEWAQMLEELELPDTDHDPS